MTFEEFYDMAGVVVRLRKDLEAAERLATDRQRERDQARDELGPVALQLSAHVESLTLSNAQCAEYLRQNEQLHSELVEVRAALAATTEQRDSYKRTLDEWSNADTEPHEPVTADDVADHVVPPVLHVGEPDPVNDPKDASLEFRNVVPTPEMIAACQWWDLVGSEKAICFKHMDQLTVVWRSAGDHSWDRWKYEDCPQPLKPHGMTWQQLDKVLADKAQGTQAAPVPAAVVPLCDKCHGCGSKLVIGRKREDGCDAIGCTALCSRSWMAFLPNNDGDARHPYSGPCKSDKPVRHE